MVLGADVDLVGQAEDDLLQRVTGPYDIGVVGCGALARFLERNGPALALRNGHGRGELDFGQQPVVAGSAHRRPGDVAVALAGRETECEGRAPGNLHQVAGAGHAVAASDEFLGQAFRHLVERKCVVGRSAGRPAAGGVGVESAIGIDLPDAVLEYVALQHDIRTGVDRVGIALAADAVVNPRCERRAAHREAGDLHRAGAVLGLDRQGVDGIDALAHRREDLEVVALKDLIVARRHRHRLLPVPAIPVGRGLREHQLRGDLPARCRRRQHHGRRARGLDRVACRHGALVGIGHRQDETGKRGTQGGERPQLVVQAQRDRAQVVAVLDIVEVVIAVQRDGPALALGYLAREVELDLRCRELRLLHAAFRVRQDREQCRERRVIARIPARRQRAAAHRHRVAGARRVDDTLQSAGDIRKGGTRGSEIVVHIVQGKTPGLTDHRRAGQFDLGLRRRRIHLDRLCLAVVVACRKRQVRVVGGGHLRHDVQCDVGRRRFAQDDLEGIRVRGVVREFGVKVVLDVEPVGRPDRPGKGLVERVGLRRRVVGEDARARSLVRPAGQRDLLADQADRVLVGIVPLQRDIQIIGLTRAEAHVAIAGERIRLQVMPQRPHFDRIGADSAQFIGMDRVGRKRAAGVRHRCRRIRRQWVDHDTIRIAQRQHRGVDIGVVLDNGRLIGVPQHGSNERIVVVDRNVDHGIVAGDAVHDLALINVEHGLHPAAALRAVLGEAGEPGVRLDHDPDVRAGARRGVDPAGVDRRAQFGGHAVDVVVGADRRVVGDAVKLHRPDVVRRYRTRQREVVLGQALGGGKAANRGSGRRLRGDPVDPGTLGDRDEVVVRIVELRDVGSRAVVGVTRGTGQRSSHCGAVRRAARHRVVVESVRAVEQHGPGIALAGAVVQRDFLRPGHLGLAAQHRPHQRRGRRDGPGRSERGAGALGRDLDHPGAACHLHRNGVVATVQVDQGRQPRRHRLRIRRVGARTGHVAEGGGRAGGRRQRHAPGLARRDRAADFNRFCVGRDRAADRRLRRVRRDACRAALLQDVDHLAARDAGHHRRVAGARVDQVGKRRRHRVQGIGRRRGVVEVARRAGARGERGRVGVAGRDRDRVSHLDFLGPGCRIGYV